MNIDKHHIAKEKILIPVILQIYINQKKLQLIETVLEQVYLQKEKDILKRKNKNLYTKL